MILSILSSPALVSSLMVVRAKNLVHSVLFPIPAFHDTSGCYSHFIPIRCYDVPYSNSGDSRRSIALFTSEWYYWTDPLVGNVLQFR